MAYGKGGRQIALSCFWFVSTLGAPSDEEGKNETALVPVSII